MTAYTVDLEHLTVLATDGAETHDLNAEGQPCITLGELRDFIGELHIQGAFPRAMRDELLASMAE